MRHANRNAKSQRYRAKKRAEDETLYKQNVTKRKQEWSEKKPDKVLKIAEGVRNRAKELCRFFCDDCEIPFASSYALDKHKLSNAHLDHIAGIEKSELGRYALARKDKKKEVRESGGFSCTPCGKAFPNESSKKRHLASKSHPKRAKKL